MRSLSSAKNCCLPVVALTGILVLAGCNTGDFYSRQGFNTLTPIASSKPAEVSTSADAPKASDLHLVALATGAVGKKIGKTLSEADRRLALSAEYQALEYHPLGEKVSWQSKTGQRHGIVTPSATYDVGSKNCRRYTHTVYLGEEATTTSATACKEQDGYWQPLS